MRGDTMKLRDLLAGVPLVGEKSDLDMEISSISYDSRTLAPGALFVAMSGDKTDGHRYIKAALDRGAAAVLCQTPPDGPGPWLVTEDSRLALALVSANWFGRPGNGMTLVAVTGTNGKTTTTYLLKAMLEGVLGAKVGLIGTNQNMIGPAVLPASRTTPESWEVQRLLRQMADSGCTHVVMEVSSHALVLRRVEGIRFAAGIFTNLTQDHLDFHKTMEAYCDAKAVLFRHCDVGVVNADDPNTAALLEGHTCDLVTYGIDSDAVDYRAGKEYRLLRSKEMLGVAFKWTEPDGRTMEVQVGMPGLFSIYNALATIGVAKVLGLDDGAIHEGLQKALVKGRVELVPISSKFTILIDYAHNEAATESLMETLKAYHPRRMVVVFGCGGNRSRLRRYGMGEVCAKMADFCILTEDNNRYEKVEDIIADIKVGMAKGNPDAQYVEIPDRLDALHYAIDHAQQGDLIAVIGKGHEAYRDREGVKTPFLERELIEEYAAEKGIE